MIRIALVMFLSLSFASTVAQAGEIIRAPKKEKNIEPTEVFYMVPPQQIADVQHPSEKSIQYMLDNYSLERMAQYAIRLNSAQIKAAEAQGTPVPAKLSRETLQSKDKIAEYLRSLYRYEY